MPAQTLVSQLASKNLTLAVVESATGGGIASAITDIPGASRVLLGGVVAYTPQAKSQLLGLPAESLPPGCVSAALTQSMAEAIRCSLKADLAMAITGALGPDSPAPHIPVGTVYIAVTGLGKSVVREFNFVGDRQTNKKAAVIAGLNFLMCFVARWYVA